MRPSVSLLGHLIVRSAFVRVFVLLAHAIYYLPYSGRGGEEERERGGNEAVEARDV